MDIAVVGLGSMGMGMARSALARGASIRGYDIRADVRAAFEAAGGRSGDTLANAVRDADVVFLVLVNAKQTEEVIFGPEGIIRDLNKGAAIVSCATLAPKDARDFAARVEEKGFHYLDAPISGGAAKAAEGRLTVMASGSPQAFAAAKPALDMVAETVYTLGGEAGIGTSFKIVNQLLAGVHIAAACEAISFAKRLGLDLTKVYEVITKSAGNSWMFENRIPHVLDEDYAPRSAVGIFTKDLGIVGDIARELRFPTPMAAEALQLFLMTAAAGMEQDDDASVARLYSLITERQ
ncbi:3-hydroxyisobutyrate dehydrogenase [Rhizobium sp. BK316]|uniref:L-threonate dehydrogenase n=1 Tax=Rhizobium sp. BK316 TaxID=2587053 RepID=UPI001607767A|nr:L-threonate dehydrogenase [Rhizobium sp. BK316]MBB3406163.1 3-hydroxyisobutyrate dehydrogenase [Rhizobium sp. BK316]